MGKTYQFGGYSVTIEEDGAILVKPGDSISKYSMARHHDFNHFSSFGRKKQPHLGPVALAPHEVNYINSGEILYHLPTFLAANPGSSTAPGQAPIPKKIAYFGIDGTGTADQSQYQVDFRHSFVNQLLMAWRTNDLGPAERRRGPTDAGFENGRLAIEAFNFISGHISAGTAEGVFLAGYSRGGAAALDAAAKLKNIGIPVDCLILFDPVDRSVTAGPWFGNQSVVSTVREVYYAQRNPATHSRPSFGNTGLYIDGSGSWGSSFKEKQMFFATHGGVGGTPWEKWPPGTFIREPQGPQNNVTFITPEMDRAGADRVQAWIWPRIFDAYSRCQER